MRKYLATLCLAAATGCGYIGAPLPPALNIPERVAVVNASQHSGQLVVGFLITGKTTDGLVLHRLRSIDLRIGPAASPVASTPAASVGSTQASMDLWAKSAQKIPVDPPKIDGYELKVPITGWENKDVIVAVRAVGPTGRAGAWSEPLTVHVVPAPGVPVVAIAPGPDGVELSWPRAGAPAETKWRIYRQRKGEEQSVAIAEATEPRWLDPITEEDSELTYEVQTLLPAGKGFAESERSKAVSITYKDVFPPATPAGLTAIAGVGSIELAWDPNHEPDLRGYQVYRAEAGGALAKLGAVTGEVTFSDSKIEHAKRYVYAVSAIDKLGNASKLSATVEVIAP
jgi:hypothetical protein